MIGLKKENENESDVDVVTSNVVVPRAGCTVGTGDHIDGEIAERGW
jgi:hypothetical protein